MSKELNGPRGAPGWLCSGTGTTLRTAYAPFTVVPQVGQPFCPPQLFSKSVSATTRATSKRTFVTPNLMEQPPLRIPLDFSVRSCCFPCWGFIEVLHQPLEAVLQPLDETKVSLLCSADCARLLQLVDVDVGREPHPVVQIPVDAKGELVRVPVEGRHILGRKNVVKEDPGLVTLNPGIAEAQFPTPPSARSAGLCGRAEYGMLHAGNAVFRPLFLGKQVGGGCVPRLEPDVRKIGESQAPQLQRTYSRAVVGRHHILVARCEGTLDEREFSLVPPNMAVHRELREPRVSRIVYGHVRGNSAREP